MVLRKDFGIEDARAGNPKDEYLKCKRGQEMICSNISLYIAKIVRRMKDS